LANDLTFIEGTSIASWS